MNMRSLAMPEPGIDARMPIVSGALRVSQTLTVAHRRLDCSMPGAFLAAPAAGAAARSTSRTAHSDRVMDRRAVRSVVVGSIMSVSNSEQTNTPFDSLYRQTASDLFAYVSSLVRDRATAEDVPASAFERAYRRQASFDPRRGSRRAWLFGIARTAALAELRRRRRPAALVTDPEDPATVAGPDDDEHAVRRAAVRAGLAALEPRDRELIALKFHAGLSNAEIADVLGI